jgi:putative ABC transport system permease protein
MSRWSRITNVFRGDRLSREIQEELEAHIEEAVREGRDPGEARRAFGQTLRVFEDSRDLRLLGWLDSLRADAVFGWRQIVKKKVTSAAAVLSLALAIGACTSAFRLIDALLLRPLPVADPQQLYVLSRHGLGFDGKPASFDGWAYPAFQQMRAAVKGQAELIAISIAQQMDLTYRSDEEMEKAWLQYVSGWMFESLGLRPALGRLLTENDDLKPGGHPLAVLSHDYWTHRFGQDPKVIGRTFRMGNDIYEIVGVLQQPFTGTEPGIVTDVFIPTMMNSNVIRSDSTWHRTLARLNPGVPLEPVRSKLHATSRAFEEDRAKGFMGMTKQTIDRFLDQKVVLEPAAGGVSQLQRDYRGPLVALGMLVALVLLIACVNVANLMMAQAAARSREMALRVSIGAGRARLIQMVLVESAWLALLASGIGAAFAWWSAPFVIGRINPPGNPVRLSLDADWRVLGFAIALGLAVTFVFGLAPALRASAVTPASALKGGEDPHSRRRAMNVLIAAQVAFCFLVLFVAGLFAATSERLSNKPLGFSAERILLLSTVSARPQSPVVWDQVADHLRSLPGIERVALADRPLLTGYASNSFISVNGAPPSEVLAYFRSVSPGWMDAMKIRLIDGSDFRASDTSTTDGGEGLAIVNETFARQYFGGENPVGKWFEKTYRSNRYRVVGVVPDVPYRSLREPILPTAYIPFRGVDSNGALRPVGYGTFILRTSGSNPLTLAQFLRQEVGRARPGFRVSNVATQEELIRAQTIREWLLATLALFFAVVALVLAGVGLYGVLDYSVLQRRREIGIRIAIGARAGDIARRVTAEVFVMVLAGAVAGLGLGLGSVRFVDTLLYGVKATDLGMLALPSLAILFAALTAALVPVLRAVRIDPVTMLRVE